MLFLEGKKQLLSTNGKDVEDRNINYPLFERDKIISQTFFKSLAQPNF